MRIEGLLWGPWGPCLPYTCAHGFYIHIDKFYDFAYISIPNPNKNFNRFFDALDLLKLNKNIKFSLLLTIPQKNKSLINRINDFHGSNIKITNVGIISHSEVIKYLNKTNIMIFPSLFESFGLPLIEAAQLKMPVIASNLPYVHEVIKPSATFDPYSPNDIASCISNIFSCSDLTIAELKCNDQIDKLFQIINN